MIEHKLAPKLLEEAYTEIRYEMTREIEDKIIENDRKLIPLDSRKKKDWQSPYPKTFVKRKKPK